MGYTVYEDATILNVFGNPSKPLYDEKTAYSRVWITGPGGGKYWKLHRFVWTAFNGEIPAEMQVDHIDNNRNNNALSNLQLLTPSENSIKARANSDADRTWKVVEQYTLDGKLVAEYSSATQAEKLTKDSIRVNHRRVSECARGKKDTHRGFVWKFKYYTIDT